MPILGKSTTSGQSRTMQQGTKPTVLEFFAGGGLARLGLEPWFETIWANDFDPMKAKAYVANFGSERFVLSDIHDIDVDTVPTADMAWASFPCQDLSLAGGRGGLSARRSSAFYGFVHVIEQMRASSRGPKVLVLENVSGLLTSRGGADFGAVMVSLEGLGYKAGALEIDARYFLPQSRPRVFIVAVRSDVSVPAKFFDDATSPFVTAGVSKAHGLLSNTGASQYVTWSLPLPSRGQAGKNDLTPLDAQTYAQNLEDILDLNDQDWWPDDKVQRLIHAFSPRHRAMLEELQHLKMPQLCTIYRRTRTKNGIKSAYAELRYDGIAGCLRTPGGGSSRQFWLQIEGQKVSARPINAREAMRLMGVSETYRLPKSELAGLKIAGDGVAVPVVAWLAEGLLMPLVSS
jgi:DNA (cytosine-5)-methyltransferase 1